jgi:predicted phage-related endonuclease
MLTEHQGEECMTTIASLQDELSSWNDKAQAAADEANKHRTNAANYSANGYADKAQSETVAAIDSDKQSADYVAKVQQISKQIQNLEHQAGQIESQIQDLQSKLAAITG